jgi:hypothetical protein
MRHSRLHPQEAACIRQVFCPSPSSSRSIVFNLNDRFSHFSGDFEDSRNFGWSVDVKGFDWKKLIDNKDKEIDRLNGIYKNLLAGSGVKLIEGRATLVGAHTVKVLAR